MERRPALAAPTPEKVAAFVAASGRPADEVVASSSRASASGTVEKIAANAVMAGCKPDVMPVVLAMVGVHPRPRHRSAHLRHVHRPTGAHRHGQRPHRDRIGMNSGVCALGPGSVSSVNASIGRSLRLIMMNVGLSYPGVSDMDTIGSSMKFSACVAENEAANPGAPIASRRATARGSPPSPSTHPTASVSFSISRTTTPISSSRRSAPPSTTRRRCAAATGSSAAPTRAAPAPSTGLAHLILLCPDHAKAFNDAGWSLNDLKQALFDGSRMSFHKLMLNKPKQGLRRRPPSPSVAVGHARHRGLALPQPRRLRHPRGRADAGRSLYHYGGTLSITRPVREV